MSRVPDTHTSIPILSRLLTRGVRTRAGMHVAGSRVLAAFAAAAILFGAQAAPRTASDNAAGTAHVARLATLHPALHAVAPHRVVLESRSPSRVPVDAALPGDGRIALGAAVSTRPARNGAVHDDGQSVVSRGYDATAPPALS